MDGTIIHLWLDDEFLKEWGVIFSKGNDWQARGHWPVSKSLRAVVDDEDTGTVTLDLADSDWSKMPGQPDYVLCVDLNDRLTVCFEVRADIDLAPALRTLRLVRFNTGPAHSESTSPMLQELDCPCPQEKSIEADNAVDVDDMDMDMLSYSPLKEGDALRLFAFRGKAPVLAWHDALQPEEHAPLLRDALIISKLYPRGSQFWMAETDADAAEAPLCSFERLALRVLAFHTSRIDAEWLAMKGERTECQMKLVGAEWWLQVRARDVLMPLHWDRDENRLHWEHVPPLLSTVTYLTGHGAPTLVLPVRSCARGLPVQGCTNTEEYAPTDLDQCGNNGAASADGLAYLSRPVAGKHLAFDGSLLHGVPLQSEISPTVLPMTGPGGLRITFLVNLWTYKPLGVNRLPPHVAQKLSDGDPFGLPQDAACCVHHVCTAAPPSPRSEDLLQVGEKGCRQPPVRVSGLRQLMADAHDQASSYVAVQW